MINHFVTFKNLADAERIELPRPIPESSPGSNRVSTPAMRASVEVDTTIGVAPIWELLQRTA